jgi:hypothetical protein
LAGASSLDAALTGRPVQERAGFGGAARVLRRISSRVSAEIDVGVGGTDVDFSAATRKQVPVARDSFRKFFDTLTQLLSDRGSPSVTAESNESGGSMRLDVAGGLRVYVNRSRRHAEFVRVVVGRAYSLSEAPTASLSGNYRFDVVTRAGQTSTYDERDSVSLNLSRGKAAWTISGGGGVEWSLGRKSGIVMEGEVEGHRRHYRLTLSASPEVTTVDDPEIVRSGIISIGAATATLPPTVVVFNNNALLSQDFPASLSGEPVRDHVVATGRSVQWRATLRIGVFYRF